MPQNYKIQTEKPEDIIDLQSYLPTAIVDLRYRGENNFTGAPLPKYIDNISYLNKEALIKLSIVERELNKQDLSLIIFDSYRPISSVNYLFNEWRYNPDEKEHIKKAFYPNMTKEEIFTGKLIDPQSKHCSGSTIDLGLWDLKKKIEVPMGSNFDFFDESSYTDSKNISLDAQKKRMLLKDLMEDNLFQNYELEWWHFSFKEDKYANILFDFDVRKEL